MLKVGVIGLGDISSIHIGIIQSSPNAELTAVCDIDERKRELINGATFYTDFHEMIKKESLDCIHICLPHHLHYSVAKECIENGIHVFLEKPIAVNTEEAQMLVKLSEKRRDVKCCVCLQNRLNETTEKLCEMINSGQYGKITGIKGLVTWNRPKSYYDEKPWRGSLQLAGGGVMINQSIHTLDLLQMFGGSIEAIRGTIDQLEDYGYEVEDTAIANIKFENGIKGLYFATNTYAENSSVEIEVVLEKAQITIKDSILILTDKEGNKEQLIEDAKLPGSKFYYGASHSKLINKFYQAIIDDTDEYIPVKEGFTSLKMIEAIRLSSESKSPVNMKEILNTW